MVLKLRTFGDGFASDAMLKTDLRARNFLNTVLRYALGVAVALFAIGLRVWLTPVLGDRNPYHTVWAAVAFAAWYCGVGPSILTALTSVFGVWWFLSDRAGIVLDRMEVSGMVGFLLFSGVIIAFGEATRRSRASMERTEQSLRESEARLRVVNQNKQREIEQRTAELEQKTTKTMEQAKLLDLANDAIFVRTADDKVSYWNQGAERLYGWAEQEAVGRLIHELLHTVFPAPLSEIAKTDRWEGELLHVKRDGSTITVASRWTTLRDPEGKVVGWLEINTDITARKRAEEAARCLSGRLLSLQDDERRRIARELHDSLGQYLVSLKVNLDLLSKIPSDAQQNALLSECLSSVEECLTETRTISHLLHPPLLDEAGFASAARWYADGFAQRSAIQVDLDLPPGLDRLDRDVETALFRVLQEALTNVHRHSGGSSVRIFLQVDADQVQLQITDNGRGIPPDRLRTLRDDASAAGVGLAGMRQRMRELGGSFEIESAFPGTTITATVPRLQRAGLSPKLSDHEDANRGASAA
jgi:PAS domain S-box-containing protein